jgi:hypothetical protein
VSRRLPPWRDDELHVVAEKCATCVFRPGNLMHLAPGRVKDLVDDNLDADAALVCHKTLPYGDRSEVGEAICRGFWDGPFDGHPTRRLAEMLGVVEEVTL